MSHLPVVMAHFGHWYASIIFAVPFLALVGLLTLGRLYERRQERRGHGGARDTLE